MDSLIIRPYRDSDKKDVVSLWRQVFPDSPSWNDPETNIKLKLAIQRDLFLVAELDNNIIGTAMAGFDGHRGWVYYVAVKPEYRRRGIGRALMLAVEQGLTRIGCTKLNLQVRSSNEETVKFYKSLGYNTENRISMGKLL